MRSWSSGKFEFLKKGAVYNFQVSEAHFNKCKLPTLSSRICVYYICLATDSSVKCGVLLQATRSGSKQLLASWRLNKALTFALTTIELRRRQQRSDGFRGLSLFVISDIERGFARLCSLKGLTTATVCSGSLPVLASSIGSRLLLAALGTHTMPFENSSNLNLAKSI